VRITERSEVTLVPIWTVGDAGPYKRFFTFLTNYAIITSERGDIMVKYILIAIVAIVILTPEILWRVYLRSKREERFNDFYSKPFVCPNCGHRFYAKLNRLRPASENKALLKCPNCGKRDLCGRPYDFEEDKS